MNTRSWGRTEQEKVWIIWTHLILNNLINILAKAFVWYLESFAEEAISPDQIGFMTGSHFSRGDMTRNKKNSFFCQNKHFQF